MLLRIKEVDKNRKYIFILALALIFLLTTFTLSKYHGTSIIYIVFTLVSNVYFFLGFNKKAFFLDTFLSLFFWLGFWLKFSLRVAFYGGAFNQQIGNFDGSPAAFDRALLIVSCALFALILSSIFRRKYLFNYPEVPRDDLNKSIYYFYNRNRKKILSFFFMITVFIGASNAVFVIYQKGRITETILPYGLNGIYKWLLLFGLSSFFAWIANIEFSKKTSVLIISLGLFETFFSNISLLSRGMILNSSALILGTFISVKLRNFKSQLRFFVYTISLAFILIVVSVAAVNYLRSAIYLDNGENRIKEFNAMTQPLFVDRWVGIEGVMAVSSYPNLGWPLWNRSLKERYDETKTSFYDEIFITSSYVETDKTKHHFISLPGIVAFLFYPGSFFFLFGSMFFLGLFGATVEVLTYKLSDENLILCSLFGQVVAYRFSSFGYVPTQSYLIFGSILLNLLIIYLINRFVGSRLAQ